MNWCLDKNIPSNQFINFSLFVKLSPTFFSILLDLKLLRYYQINKNKTSMKNYLVKKFEVLAGNIKQDIVLFII